MFSDPVSVTEADKVFVYLMTRRINLADSVRLACWSIRNAVFSSVEYDRGRSRGIVGLCIADLVSVDVIMRIDWKNLA